MSGVWRAVRVAMLMVPLAGVACSGTNVGSPRPRTPDVQAVQNTAAVTYDAFKDGITKRMVECGAGAFEASSRKVSVSYGEIVDAISSEYASLRSGKYRDTTEAAALRETGGCT